MPSTASPTVLIELQAVGENLNTWGTRLNTALKMLEAAAHGLTSHTLTANKALTYTNFELTDGTDGIHIIAAASDGAYTVTLSGYERSYFIINKSSYVQTFTAGGVSVDVAAGERINIYCDATDVYRDELRTISGALSVSGAVTASTVPTDNAHLVNKLYADGLALAQSDLPGQNASNKNATTASDGSAASWQHDIKPEVITTGETAVARRQPYLCDLSSGSFTLTLPASPSEGDFVRFITDLNASVNNLTIGRNSETIGGTAADMTVDFDGFSGTLFYTSSNWTVFAS